MKQKPISAFSIKIYHETRKFSDPLNVRQPLFMHTYVHLLLKILMASRTSIIELNKMVEGGERKCPQSIENK